MVIRSLPRPGIRYFKARGFPSVLANYIMWRDNHTCIYCGNRAHEIDHVVPFSKGGKTIRANGVACCLKCNRKKSNSITGDYLVKGLAYLTKIGEDIKWIDTSYAIQSRQPNEVDIDYIYKMLSDGLDSIEISQLLNLNVESVQEFI